MFCFPNNAKQIANDTHPPAAPPQVGNAYPSITRSSAFVGIPAESILVACNLLAVSPADPDSIPEMVAVEGPPQLIAQIPSSMTFGDDG